MAPLPTPANATFVSSSPGLSPTVLFWIGIISLTLSILIMSASVYACVILRKRVIAQAKDIEANIKKPNQSARRLFKRWQKKRATSRRKMDPEAPLPSWALAYNNHLTGQPFTGEIKPLSLVPLPSSPEGGPLHNAIQDLVSISAKFKEPQPRVIAPIPEIKVECVHDEPLPSIPSLGWGAVPVLGDYYNRKIIIEYLRIPELGYTTQPEDDDDDFHMHPVEYCLVDYALPARPPLRGAYAPKVEKFEDEGVSRSSRGAKSSFRGQALDTISE